MNVVLFLFGFSVSAQKNYIGKYKVTEKYLGYEDGCCPLQNPKIQRYFSIKTAVQWKEILTDSLIVLKFEGHKRAFKVEEIILEYPIILEGSNITPFYVGKKYYNLPKIILVPADWWLGETLVFECFHQ